MSAVVKDWTSADVFLIGHRIPDQYIQHVLNLKLNYPGDEPLYLFETMRDTPTREQELITKIRNHARLRRFKPGDAVLRGFDYTNTAFLILKGTVAASPAVSQPDLWKVLKKFFTRKSRPVKTFDPGHNFKISKGHIVGLCSVADRVRQTSEIVAHEDLLVLEMRWPLLSHILKSNQRFRLYLDFSFRHHVLGHFLLMQHYLSNLSPECLGNVLEHSTLEFYGDPSWDKKLKLRNKQEDGVPRGTADYETILGQGSEIKNMYLVWSGFARIVRQTSEGSHTFRFLRRNEMWGFTQIAQRLLEEQYESLSISMACMQSVGYTKMVEISGEAIANWILPSLGEHDRHTITYDRRLERLRTSKSGLEQKFNAEVSFEAGARDFIEDYKLLNGQRGMLINLDRCVRCFDCVDACADLHNGTSVFSWHGLRYGNFMISNACMHCQDPVCMTDCPTNAISRSGPLKVVSINEDTCIGCGACAESCPYDNIRMMDILQERGGFSSETIGHDVGLLSEEESYTPVLKATKCDLCTTQAPAPACQKACPHDALLRVDVSDMKSITEWIKRR